GVHRRLHDIADTLRRGDEIVSGAPRPKSGTRLLRQWQGRTLEGVVTDDGFLWQHARYRSLSQIAREITRTRWSGPVFFGLKPRTVPPHSPADDANAAV